MQLMYDMVLTAALVILGAGMILALIRVIRGPRIADRIMGVNMVGTLAICAIAVLSKLLGQAYLLDVCLIYCLLSFLAVVVLCKIYITVHLRAKSHDKEGK